MTNKKPLPPQQGKLVKTLRVLLGLQLVMYIWGISIVASAPHNTLDGLAAMYPLGMFVLLTPVNLALLVIYLIKTRSREDASILILSLVNVLLIVFYDPIINWALYA